MTMPPPELMPKTEIATASSAVSTLYVAGPVAFAKPFVIFVFCHRVPGVFIQFLIGVSVFVFIAFLLYTPLYITTTKGIETTIIRNRDGLLTISRERREKLTEATAETAGNDLRQFVAL